MCRAAGGNAGQTSMQRSLSAHFLDGELLGQAVD